MSSFCRFITSELDAFWSGLLNFGIHSDTKVVKERPLVVNTNITQQP